MKGRVIYMEIIRFVQKVYWVCASLLMMVVPVVTQAVEIEFPVSAYTPDKLSEVRVWEKTWVGKKIDSTNIDQVAMFLPKPYAEMFKNPEKWNAPPEGNYFYIGPYKRVVDTKGMIEATKKYAPLVKTDAEGRIFNYADIAGMPFPVPKNGLEVAYNVECQTRGDAYKYEYYCPVINPRTKSDRLSKQQFTEMFWIHRVDTVEKPRIKKNPKGYHKSQFMHMLLPPEMNNTRFITLRFIDDTMPDISYLYYSQFRRIRRMSTTERTNAIDGTDQIYDDGNMWDGHVMRNTYTLKGKKDMLLSRHQDMTKVIRKPGQAVADGYTFERCSTYVVEVVNKEADYIYSKRIWYIDPESYVIHWQEMYDQLGRYWKCFMQQTNDIKTAKGEMKNFVVGLSMHDYQRSHSGYNDITRKPIQIGIDVRPNIFTLSNLQKTY
jgi:hypothetical protein